jgi:preprotein translocase subunit SecG
MLIGVLIAVHILVCLALIGVILLQRSEGGALGMGGGPSGFMTARGAGNLLTRSTSILGGVFFLLSLTLTLLAGGRTSSSVTDRLDIQGLDTRSLTAPATTPNTTAPATTGLPAGTPNAPANPFAAPVIEAPRPTGTQAPAAPATTTAPAPVITAPTPQPAGAGGDHDDHHDGPGPGRPRGADAARAVIKAGSAYPNQL